MSHEYHNRHLEHQSVRLRAPIVEQLLRDEAPDVLCLQECKCPTDKFPYETFADLGWSHAVVRGEKGYNGVAILARIPLEDVPTAMCWARATPAMWRRGWKTA